MPGELNSRGETREPTIYRIRLEGHLGRQWADWFGGLAVTLENNGNTLLAGPLIDQAALYGVLKKVRDLGMPLISVNRVDADPTVAADSARAKEQRQ